MIRHFHLPSFCSLLPSTGAFVGSSNGECTCFKLRLVLPSIHNKRTSFASSLIMLICSLNRLCVSCFVCRKFPFFSFLLQYLFSFMHVTIVYLFLTGTCISDFTVPVIDILLSTKKKNVFSDFSLIWQIW